MLTRLLRFPMSMVVSELFQAFEVFDAVDAEDAIDAIGALWMKGAIDVKQA
jgi:hypothetical protein